MHIMVISRGVPSKEYPTNGIFEYDQARALKEAGHNVSFAAIDLRSIRKKRKLGLQKYAFDGIDIFHYSFPCGPIPNAILAKAGVYLYKKVFAAICDEKGRPDIVHAHFAVRNGFYAAKGLVNNDVPLIVTEHDGDVLNKRLSREKLKQLRYTTNRAFKIICVSNALKRSVSELTGCNRIVVIPNAISNEFTYKEHYRATTGFKFISVSRLYEVKRNKLLINAFCAAFQGDPNVSLTIIGGGPLESELKAYISSESKQNRIHLTGYLERSDIINMLTDADAFVLASVSETFGVVYAEALACGIPAISTQNGGANDIIDSSNGLLVPIDNLEALTEALKKMRTTAHLYDRRQIAVQASSKFSSGAVAAELLDVYHDAVRSEQDAAK